MSKFIFVTGGVVSSIGKGITSASLGMLLEARGVNVRMMKLDPYVNVDPGTMSPYQHGEVYVTEDGAETDLDIGHYQRYTNGEFSKNSSITTGKVYLSVINKERRGDYLGGTVQVIPHVTNEIKDMIKKLATKDTDVVIAEIGGTVGDIESLPFVEAIRQLGHDVGRKNVAFIHVTLLPYLAAAHEMKTKPTQHSVGKLREIGIFPDMLMCRSEHPIPDDMKDKLALFCDVDKEFIIEQLDAKGTIYEVPLMLAEQKVDELICERLQIGKHKPDLTEWRELVDHIINPDGEVEIAVVGKYIEHQDAYKSIYESLTHGGVASRVKVKVRRIEGEDVEKEGAEKLLSGVHGVLVPGGFGGRGVEGKIAAVQYARENKIPYFGICLGMQCATIEFARNKAGLAKANSTEFDKENEHPVISLLSEQENVTDLGGTMRLGNWDCTLTEGTKVFEAYGKADIGERHRHRYEFNGKYRDQLEKAGLVVAGTHHENGTDLVEIVEIPDHPWFVGVQFHPEFKSKLAVPHPLFRDFVAAAKKNKTGNNSTQEAVSSGVQS